MAFARLNGIEIFFERRGDGPRLLFLNGSGATLEGAALLLAPFVERFDLLAHDQRGLGRTEIPPGPYTMSDYAADAMALVDRVGWESTRVVGISFGGMVAQELAVTWPDRVERLALLCTSSGGTGGSSYPLHELADLGPDDRAEVSTRILDTRFTSAWLAEHPADRLILELMQARALERKTDEQRRGEAEQFGARRHHDVWDRLPAISCPTLVASGRYDGIAPTANGEAIAARIPAADLRYYEGGHAFFAQDPTALSDVVAFLGAS